MFPRFTRSFRAAFWTQAFVFGPLALAAFTLPARAQSSQDPIYIFHTNLGNISVQLFPDVTPQTVANFLSYVNLGDYTNSLIHRSVPGFIFQGGSYQVQNNSVITTPTNAPVVNEFHLSNTRGTIAMAKLGSQVNSATSGWFFNESDSNATNLDNQNGGFTVFGKVTDSASLAVMDQIAAVPVPSPPPYSSPFNELPILNYQSGASVMFSQFVTVSYIAPASGAHILWNNSGTASIWNYTGADGSFTQNTYIPTAGYTANAIADSNIDGLTRVLWTKADGTASIWRLNNAADTYSQYTFGPYVGWAANSISVGTDNTTHVLWTNANTASIWNYSTTNGTFTQNTYGPYPGWTAVAIADGTDGQMRVLWSKADGTTSIWSLNNTTGVFSQFTFGPYAGWKANAISVGTDNTTHVLWTNANTASIWNYSTTNGTFTQNTYGPYPTWTANSIADGPDGRMRVLWANTDGRASLWRLDNSAGSFSQYTFGTYTGWTANAISGGN